MPGIFRFTGSKNCSILNSNRCHRFCRYLGHRLCFKELQDWKSTSIDTYPAIISTQNVDPVLLSVTSYHEQSVNLFLSAWLVLIPDSRQNKRTGSAYSVRRLSLSHPNQCDPTQCNSGLSIAHYKTLALQYHLVIYSFVIFALITHSI